MIVICWIFKNLSAAKDPAQDFPCCTAMVDANCSFGARIPALYGYVLLLSSFTWAPKQAKTSSQSLEPGAVYRVSSLLALLLQEPLPISCCGLVIADTRAVLFICAFTPCQPLPWLTLIFPLGAAFSMLTGVQRAARDDAGDQAGLLPSPSRRCSFRL